MTVLQNLLKHIDTMPFAGSEDHSYLVNLIDQELLKAEEKQIRDAFEAGYKRAEFIVSIGKSCPDRETYIKSLKQ